MNIHAGFQFNISITSTIKDELITFGYIRQIQNLLPFDQNTFYIIPSSINVICLQFYGNNSNQYWGSGSNEYGQLALSDLDGYTPFTLIESIQNLNIRMSKLCSGSLSDKLLWITTNGQMYISGGYVTGK